MNSIFRILYVTNLFIALYLLLISCRHLAYGESEQGIIIITFAKCLLLLAFTMAGAMINKVAGKCLVGASLNILPWILVLLFSLVA
ncbi:hypothetical protein CLV98_103178 [Dyadobacter jejuensis]|uniref:Uncharacterized protein n=1 Tax=Dyadobacter jejuensis TaxID=1082580 RepID=A0A316AMT4_9BACT|nr:hypothetical protein [Dyadobacter jejuensis]PWJ58811.1 hypothetical protein CLV98_103178 [Dyadobacter jejuensis]